MLPEGNKTPPVCKFGDKCYKNQTGQCKFYHPPQNSGRGHHNNKNDNRNHNQSGYHQNNHHFQGGRGGNQQNNQHFQGGRGGNQQNYNNNQMDLSNQICRFFQVSQCSKGQQCKKKHIFTLDNSLKRVYFTRNTPNDEIASLGYFCNDKGQNFLSLRMGLKIQFYQYFSQTKKFYKLEMADWCLPEVKQGYKYYDHKKEYIYFSFINQNTQFINIGFRNMFTQQIKIIENAHQKDITGMVHFNDNFLLSSSLDGTIKIWKKEGDNFLLDKGPTQNLNKCYDPKNQLRIMFMNFKKFQQENITVLAAGTNDNRLLLWIGQDMDHKQVLFNQKYNKVVRIEYVKYKSEWLAMIIAWGGNDNSCCGLIAVSLNSLNSQVVVHKQIQNSQELMCQVASIGNLLLVSILSGVVSIYKVPEFNSKLGIIFSQNPLCSIFPLYSMSSTNIPIKDLFILQKKSHKKQGSFSIYTLNQ